MNSDYRWWRNVVGGLWKEIGELQFKYLIKQGLKTDHYLLDVGCGSLRGGIHFINYLEKQHYFGIDKSEEILEAGKIELDENNLTSKEPRLVCLKNFEFNSLDQKFDFAIAQSVFTHLETNDIEKCVLNVEQVLTRGGKFYATFFEKPKEIKNNKNISHKTTDGPDIITYDHKDPYHYTFDELEKVCKNTSMKIEYIGDWNHPRSQKIVSFTKIP
jgi:SAM-dependent methyltransferase